MTRKELLGAVEAVMPGVDSAEDMGMNFLIFDNGWVRSYKNSVSISYPLPDANIQCSIKAEEFCKVLDRMEGETIRFFLDGTKLVVKDARTTLKMNIQSQEQHDQLINRIKTLNTGQLTWNPLPEDFIDALGVCVISAATEQSAGAFSGICINKNQMVSTDRYRITAYNLPSSLESPPFSLPREVCISLCKMNRKFPFYSLESPWFHLKDDGNAVASARILAESYPVDSVIEHYTTIKPKDEEPSFSFPPDIGKSIERVEILAGTGDKSFDFMTQITLERKENFLVISGEKEFGDITDKTPWSVDIGQMPEGIILKVNPKFMKKILELTKTFKLTSSKKAVFFVTEKMEHVMAAREEGK